MSSAYRRAAALMIAALLAGGYAVWMASMPWYAHTSGALLDPAALTAGVLRSSSGPRAAMAQIAGAPAPVTLLTAGMIVAGVGFVLRLSILPLLAVGALWMARASATHSEMLLLSGRYTREFTLASGGSYEGFLVAVWVAIGLTLALAGQLAYLGHLERRASGDDGDSSLMQIPALARFGSR